jgi:DNA-binding MarR family transcriptional regulator
MVSEQVLTVVPKSIRAIRKLTVNNLSSGMSLEQLRVLFLINEKKSQCEMSETLQISEAAISKMTNVLVQKGMVDRLPGKDRRCHELKLTKEGKKTLQNLSKALKKILDTKLKELTRNEISQLKQGLVVLEKVIGLINEA